MSRDDASTIWAASAGEAAVYPTGAVRQSVDIAIVGGGFTGLSTALHCAERGLSAQVIEAYDIGHGGSGRNAGLVNAAAWLPPTKVRRVLGETYGPRFVSRFSRAPEYVFSLIEKHQIRCDVTRTGTIHAAHAESGLRDLKDRHAEWQRLGEPVDLLGPEEVAARVGTHAFHGGLLDHRAGTINPLSYCQGLARAAVNAGATITTRVRVLDLERKSGLWHLRTSDGEIAAKSVVLGTNAYTDNLWPGLNGTFTTIGYFQFATKPLGDRLNGILPGRQGLWDTGTIMTSLRRDAQDRLIVGSMGRVMGDAASGLSRRWAARHLRRLFPDLGPVEFEEAWHGDIAMTPEHLPRIHRLDEGLYAPIGYNGRGITTGTVFGQAMSELLTGHREADLPLPVTSLSADRWAPIKSRFFETVFAANQVVKGF
ncbi:MAG: FAD-binding oxidoreductase [Pseudomonadota bacterium]